MTQRTVKQQRLSGAAEPANGKDSKENGSARVDAAQRSCLLFEPRLDQARVVEIGKALEPLLPAVLSDVVAKYDSLPRS